MPKFVEGYADSLEVPADKRETVVWDDALPGFGIRKFATGRASYIVQYDFGAVTRRISLGAVVDGNLKAMRKAASEVLSKRNLGQDTAAAKRAAMSAATALTVGDLVPAYLEERKADLKPRTHKEVARHLEKACKRLHASPAAGVSRSDVVALLDKIAASSGPTAADRVRSSLSTFFGWCIDRQHAEANPCNDIKDRAPANGGRDRTLTPAELREVWLAVDQDHDHDRIVRLLILTGQRREEIGGLAWTELGQRRIELPPERTKNKRHHVVPLSKAALVILESVERREDSAYVFGRLGTPFSGWSRCKARLDVRITSRRKEVSSKAEPMPHWTLHDLRRSFATLMREQRLADSHLIELIVNHVSGTRGGIAGVYDRSERLEERAAALEKWGRYVSKLVSVKPSRT